MTDSRLIPQVVNFKNCVYLGIRCWRSRSDVPGNGSTEGRLLLDGKGIARSRGRTSPTWSPCDRTGIYDILHGHLRIPPGESECTVTLALHTTRFG